MIQNSNNNHNLPYFQNQQNQNQKGQQQINGWNFSLNPQQQLQQKIEKNNLNSGNQRQKNPMLIKGSLVEQNSNSQSQYVNCLKCKNNTGKIIGQLNNLTLNKLYHCLTCNDQGYLRICECGLFVLSHKKFPEYQIHNCTRCKRQLQWSICPNKQCSNVLYQIQNAKIDCQLCQNSYTFSQCTRCQNFVSITQKQYFLGLDVQCEECQIFSQELQCFNCKGVKASPENLEKCNECPEFMYPISWKNIEDNQLNQDFLVKVDKFSLEWMKVVEFFIKDLENIQNQNKYEIININRIQNKILWKNYQFEKEKMKEEQKLQGLVPKTREVMLWHGTFRTDPRQIFQNSKEGFSQSCYQKKNNSFQPVYFSENSEYCAERFSYPQIDGKGRQTYLILLCSVVCGYSQTLNQDDKNQQQPQYFNNYNQQEGQFDSVRIKTNGGKDYYKLFGNDARRAYPTHIIAFQRKMN